MSIRSLKTVTCNKCKWVYMQVTRKFAETSVESFNKYFKSLSKKDQKDMYGGKGSSVKDYEKCKCGNSYKNFVDSKAGDCPDGSTVSPIINRKQ